MIQPQPLTGIVTMSPTSIPQGLPRLSPASAPMLRAPPREISPPNPPNRPLRNMPSQSSVKSSSPLVKNKLSSRSMAASPDSSAHEWDNRSHRTTAKPPVRTMPFAATLISHTTRASPTSASHVLVTLSFAYSLDDPPSNNSVSLPWEALRMGGGHLLDFVQGILGEHEEESQRPEMTDGESAEESDFESEYGPGALLR